MKKIVTLILALMTGLATHAQLDRSKKPEAAPAKEIQIGTYEKFELKNGLKVIVVENRKLPRVAFSLIFDREPLVEGDKVGYLGMVGQLIRSGTTTRTKAALDEAVDFIGADLSVSSTSVYGASLTKHRDKMLDLFTDVLYNPSFPEEELEKIKKQTISGLKASQEDPGAISRNVRSRLLYGDEHPYGEVQTEEHVDNITMEDIKAYYSAYFKPNIAYLVIVGDINAKEAKKIVNKRFGKWEPGEVDRPTYELPQQPEKNVVAIVNRTSAVQTDLSIGYPIDLKPGTKAHIQARVMNQVLGGSSASRLFKNIREDKAYTYGAYSSVSADELVGSFYAGAAVRTEVTDSSMTEFLGEMNRIINEEVGEEELQLAKNVIIGSFGRSLERPQTVASFAVNMERYNLPPNYYNDYVKNISSVTAADVKAIAKKYIRPENTYIIAVGKAGEISEGLAKFGTVKYYDTNGNEVDPSLAKLPSDVTSSAVFNAYIDAIGGREKIAAVESVQIKMEGEVMGRKMNIEVNKMAPNMASTEVKVAGNTMQKEVFDGEKGIKSGMRENGEIAGDEALDLAITSSLFEEVAYLDNEVDAQLVSVENINGSDAYGVQVTLPSGKQSIRYYDIDSGLLVQVTTVVETGQGSITLNTEYVDYGEFGGVLFPVKIRQPLNAQIKLDINATEITVNKEMDASMFSTN